MVILEIGISFFGTDLVRTKFMLYWFPIFLIYCFHGNIDYLENHIHPKHQSFSNNWHNFRIGQIMQGKVGKMPFENARYGLGKTISNHPA